MNTPSRTRARIKETTDHVVNVWLRIALYAAITVMLGAVALFLGIVYLYIR